MTVVAITRSFNEVDIIESSIRRMLTQVDHIIVGDNSTDGTREILETLPVTVFDDTEPNFRQREVLNGYAQLAREQHDAQWVVPFDIDEVWYADEGRIADRLRDLPDEVLLAPAMLLTHCVTTEDDPHEADPVHRMGWRDIEVLPLRKVACRARPDLFIDHGNHSARFHGVRYAPEVSGVLGARHYPYRSPDQFVKRVLGAYPQLQTSGLPRSHGAHMWGYGEHWERGGEDGLRDWFNTRMTFDRPDENPALVYDPLPPCPR